MEQPPPDSAHTDVSGVPLSRRDFLMRTGQMGGLIVLAGPALRHALILERGARAASTPLSVVAGMTSGPLPPSVFSGLEWRMLGPFRGGRVDAVCGVVGRPSEFYFGHVNGGVWKTIDAGRVWEPVFDDQPVASIGALAVAPSAPDVVYVGSGESTLRDSVGFGNGMYKSTDAGKSWTHIGLEDTQHIGKIAVDPHNPDVVFVAAIGHFYGSNEQRGIFRSKDGGKTWQKVLYKGPDVGAIEVVIDPSNPKVVYAGLWNTRRPPWFVYPPTNGPGGGLFKSTNGGDTWTQLTAGLPAEGIGRTGIAVAPSDTRRVYAVVDCLLPVTGAPSSAPATGGAVTSRQGGCFRSDDAGASWTRLSDDQALWGRGWYFEHVVVDPGNPDIVYVSNVSISRSMDGGKSWVPVRGSPGGDDYHQAWISPDNTNLMITASDQGCVITHNAKEGDPTRIAWSSWLNQPTAQIYHLSVDYRRPYWVTGAQQDSGAVAVRSRGKFGEISMRDWEPIGAGGESGYTAGDPRHPGIVFGGAGARFNLAENRFIPGTTTPQTKDPRHDWTQPLVLSPADPTALYYGDQFLYRTSDGAVTWTRISPDLTRADPEVPPGLDRAATEDTDTNGRRGVIYTIAPSPVEAPLLWIGTDDGLIQVTMNGGASWENVTPPALTAWSRVTMIEASRHDVNTAYASVDRHQLEDFDPYIYRTHDRGRTWTLIASGLPKGVYVHSVKEDPERKGMLFCGTERGVYLSFDEGEHWQPLQLNLPVTSMRDLQVYQNDLIIATHGRGFWVIDDIAVLRQVNEEIAGADAWLFKPSDQTSYEQGGDDGTPVQKDEPQAANPPDGVVIDYYLRAEPPGPVTLEIVDATGRTLHTFSSEEPSSPRRAGGIPNTTALWRPAPKPVAKVAGMHRVVWVPNTGRRGGFGGGFRGGVRDPEVTLPGTFTARLTVNGKSSTQSFSVKPDPRPVDKAEL